MNKVILTGNLCKPIEPRYLGQTDKKVIQNTIAVKRDFKNKQGEYDSDFINVIVYGSQANFVEQYVSKGDKVCVCGRWQHRSYDYQGQTRYVDELVVENIELVKKTQINGDRATKPQGDINTPPQTKTTLRAKEMDVSDEFQPTLTGKSTFISSDFDPNLRPVLIEPDHLPFY